MTVQQPQVPKSHPVYTQGSNFIPKDIKKDGVARGEHLKGCRSRLLTTVSLGAGIIETCSLPTMAVPIVP